MRILEDAGINFNLNIAEKVTTLTFDNSSFFIRENEVVMKTKDHTTYNPTNEDVYEHIQSVRKSKI